LSIQDQHCTSNGYLACLLLYDTVTSPLLACCLVLPTYVTESCNVHSPVNRVVLVVNFIWLEHGWRWRRCLFPWNNEDYCIV